MRQRTLDMLLTALTLSLPVAAILALAILGLTMMGWMERHLAGPLIAGIRGALLLPGSF